MHSDTPPTFPNDPVDMTFTEPEPDATVPATDPADAAHVTTDAVLDALHDAYISLRADGATITPGTLADRAVFGDTSFGDTFGVIGGLKVAYALMFSRTEMIFPSDDEQNAPPRHSIETTLANTFDALIAESNAIPAKHEPYPVTPRLLAICAQTTWRTANRYITQRNKVSH